MVQQHSNVKFRPGSILFNENVGAYCVVTTWGIGQKHIWYKALVDGGGIDFFQEGIIIIRIFNNYCVSCDNFKLLLHFFFNATITEHLREIDASEMAAAGNIGLGKYFTEYNGTCYVPNEEFQSSLSEAEDHVRYKSKQISEIENSFFFEFENMITDGEGEEQQHPE